ncbi:oligoendopeptidase F [Sphingomonas sp. PAMC 26617]|uniref:oligoendopeptidase F n=1 Tax=Sphingomonas sp. PAMC 26617 TaxID=1112216 RepID=UPI00028865B4|nr:oligoendopeptidase F [Sphingomonas sp. PAMC 26617]
MSINRFARRNSCQDENVERAFVDDFRVPKGVMVRRSLLGVALSGFAMPTLAQLERAGISTTEPSWNLADIYPNVASRDEARTAVLGHLDTLREANPIDSPDTLLEVLRLQSDLERQAEKVETYATLAADADHRDAPAQERLQLANALSVKMDDAAAWIPPAVVRLT